MEFFDIVDKKNDTVVGRASKEEAYAKLLPHRIVHVLIFNDRKLMALQLRSALVSFCPLHWSTTVGGHVQAGEKYEEAALREYQEELGDTSGLKFFHKDLYEVPNVPPKFLATFTTTFNGPFNPDPSVVADVKYVTLEKIQNMIHNGEKFHPEFKFILEKYFL